MFTRQEERESISETVPASPTADVNMTATNTKSFHIKLTLPVWNQEGGPLKPDFGLTGHVHKTDMEPAAPPFVVSRVENR